MVKTAANRQSLLWRGTLLMLMITTLMGGFGFRLAQLQLVQGEYHHQRAESNRIRPIPIPADRGNVFDRNGKVLATSQLSRGVYLWPRLQSPAQWQLTADRLEKILNIPAEEILKRLEKTGYNSPLPVTLTQQISPIAFVGLVEQSEQLPGVEIFTGSSRHYPYKTLAAHVIGYIGEATEADMKAHPEYPNGMIVGLTGVERLANDQLVGTWGQRRVEVNAQGKEVRLVGAQPAEGGTDVKLTLNAEMQLAAEKGLNGRRGAAVALDVRTGEILVLASSPTFDPGFFTRSFSETEWEKYQSGSQPFLNRALQGYPPGSTFKIVTSTAGMESGKFTPSSTLMTSAFLNLGGHQFWEHSNSGYGVIGFREALTVSSNTFFYQVGLAAGPEAIARWGHILGIGTTDIDIEGNFPGYIPTPAEKEKLFNEPWYGGDTVSMAIGQGLVQATPLELAVMVSAIANGGQRVKPHLLMSQTNQPAIKPEPTGIAPETIKVIQSGLVSVVQEGTGRRLNDGSIPLTAGKTGTSEVVGQKSHALFVGYGPAENPQIAVAVVVENGGYGGVAAVPIAHEMYKAYFGAARR
jgi:penicillin-binding protein 2